MDRSARGLVDQVNAQEPARQDRIGCRIIGDTLHVEIEREMTPLEEALERAAAGEKLAEDVRGLFHADGTPVPDAIERLRRIAGI